MCRGDWGGRQEPVDGFVRGGRHEIVGVGGGGRQELVVHRRRLVQLLVVYSTGTGSKKQEFGESFSAAGAQKVSIKP